MKTVISALLVLSLSGCARDSAPATPTVVDGPFWGLVIHELDVSVDEAAYPSLVSDPTTYVHASVDIDGTTYSDVGFRLKGGYGSFVPWDGGADDGEPKDEWVDPSREGKSAFILDLDRWVKGGEHRGIEKLVVNNMVQDPTFVHEYGAYRLFREGGVPASRTAWAHVVIDGKDRGLYALIEANDDDPFLEQWFGNDDGDIYEGAYGVDLETDQVAQLDHDHGDDTALAHPLEVSQALDAVGTGDPTAVLQTYFDLDEYASFAATELVLGHWDGYAWTTNNYKLHRDDQGHWQFVPWGLDQTFGDTLGQYGGVLPDGWASEKGAANGRIHTLCLSSDACRNALADAFERVLADIQGIGLADEMDAAAALVAPYVKPSEFEEKQDARGFLAERPDQIEPWLPCLRGGTVDFDGDGYDGCALDCDDRDPSVHPGATEVCNARDDDCNGVLDDPSECTGCIEQTMDDGRDWAFCFKERPWAEADTTCRDLGLELVSIHQELDVELVTWGFFDLMPSEERWIGLNDLQTEGQFEWSDGTPVDFSVWRPGAPDPAGEPLDCVYQGWEGWADAECVLPKPFVCR